MGRAPRDPPVRVHHRQPAEAPLAHRSRRPRQGRPRCDGDRGGGHQLPGRPRADLRDRSWLPRVLGRHRRSPSTGTSRSTVTSRSASDTIPSNRRSSSRTGTARTAPVESTVAISAKGASGPTDSTPLVMTSETVVRRLPLAALISLPSMSTSTLLGGRAARGCVCADDARSRTPCTTVPRSSRPWPVVPSCARGPVVPGQPAGAAGWNLSVPVGREPSGASAAHAASVWLVGTLRR